MKKSLISSVIIIATAYSSMAAANEDVYVTGKMGVSVVNTYGNNSDFSGNGIVNGSSKLGSHTKGVLGGGAAIGYDFYDKYKLPMRLEFEASFRGADETSGAQSVATGNASATVDEKHKVRMTTYMVNGYYDFHNSTAFTPYVSAGIGIAHVKLKDNVQEQGAEYGYGVSGSKNNFAWGVGVGTQYTLTENIALDASYRYINAGKATASTSDDGFNYHSESKTASNDFMVGVTYSF